MPTINLQVAASSDDARNVNGNGAYNGNAVTMHLGINTPVDYWNGWRWLNATIPQGATINSAVIDLYSAGLTGSNALAIFYGINEDNTATFANSTANKPEGRPRTTASVSKTFSTGGTGFGIATIDVTALVQEIVNRPGWVSGNAIGVVAHDNGSANNNYQAHSTWDFSGNARGAQLAIDYTAGGGATGQIKIWSGSSFLPKPVKVWNGSSWVAKPVKVWNGTAWVTTPY